MELVGIISDTHGRLSASAYSELADCDVIVHVGDIGSPDIIAQLRCLAPVVAVLGNNDIPEYGSEITSSAEFSCEGVLFLITHKPDDLHRLLFERKKEGRPLPQVAVHGHTHIPEITQHLPAFPSVSLVCPGSASRPRGGSKASVMKLRCEKGAVLDISLIELS